MLDVTRGDGLEYRCRMVGRKEVSVMVGSRQAPPWMYL